MKVASKKCGISSIKNEEEFNGVLKSFNFNLETSRYNLPEGSTLHKIAKYFSAQFQSLSKGCGYLTGRKVANENIVNETGRRLFRVCTNENIEAFKNMKNLDGKGDENSDLTSSLGASSRPPNPSPIPSSPSGFPADKSPPSRTSSSST
jgi:hypothetical protein